MRKTIIFILTFFLAIPLIFAQNIEQKAKNGNVQSMYDLAQEYYSGIGRIQNQANALIWFERAANKNHIQAMYRTAQMYEKGISTKVSLRQAFNYYMLAAEKGHFASQLIVAQKLEKGEGVTKSDSRAYLWYRVCADRDEVLACRKIGDYHRDGKIVLKDHSQAKYWYEKAIEQNDIEAKSSLAYLYVANEGLAPNITEAKNLNKEPLAKQIPISYFVEAMINKHEGEGSYKEAFQNFQKAKQLGIKQADYYLAMMYYNGEGTTRNLPKAFSIMESLPSEHDFELGYLMGEAYLKGDQVAADTLKAIEYYNKSAQAQNPAACRAIALIYNSGYAGKKGLNQAKIWIQKAEEIENPQQKNTGVRKNTSKK